MAASNRLLGDFCKGTLPLLHRRTSGRRLLSSVKDILATDRLMSFDRFHETSGICTAQYEAAGAETEVYAAPTGGRIGSGRWVIPEAEDVVSSTLDVVAPVRRRVADYAKTPANFVGWSAATAPGGLECELAVIESKEDMAALAPGSMRGKMLLLPGQPAGFLAAASRSCASGVILDIPVPSSPDAVKWTRLGWGGLSIADAPLRTVAFSVSANTAKMLRDLARTRGPVRLRARVDVRHYAGTHDVVSGIVQGRERPEEEVWALAHTMEPGALDNSSGAAVCLEIARALEGLIAEGSIARPRRSIRLLTAYECYGFFYYYENAPRQSAPLAGVVLDAVGATPSVCGRRLLLHSTVPMSASFVNGVAEALLRAALKLDNPGYRLTVGPFRPNSDNLLGDPQYGFPCPWLAACYRPGGKIYDAYHSSADTLATLSARGLASSTAAMAGYLYYLADAGNAEAEELAAAETRRVLRALDGLSGHEASYAADQARVSLKVLRRWMGGEGGKGGREARRGLDEMEAQIKRAAGQGGRSRSKGPVARRTAPVTPSQAKMPTDLAAALKGTDLPPWALYAVDGRRTVAEVAAAVSVMLNKKVTARKMQKYLDIHEAIEYVEWVRRP